MRDSKHDIDKSTLHRVAYPFIATSHCASAQRPGKYSGSVSIRCTNTSPSDKPLFNSVSPVDGKMRVELRRVFLPTRHWVHPKMEK